MCKIDSRDGRKWKGDGEIYKALTEKRGLKVESRGEKWKGSGQNGLS